MNLNFTHAEYELVIENDSGKIIKWFDQGTFTEILSFDVLFFSQKVLLSIDVQTLLNLESNEDVMTILSLIKIGTLRLKE